MSSPKKTGQTDLTNIPTSILEEELARRSVENQRIESVLECLRTAPEGYKHYGDDVLFNGEDFIDLLRRNWHLCLVSGAVEFNDMEQWLRYVFFEKDDPRASVKGKR